MSKSIHFDQPRRFHAIVGGIIAMAAATAVQAQANPVWPPAAQVSPTDECSGPVAATGTGTVYDVGPGKPYTELTNVPWLSLKAGDVVNIYHRATPYRTKFLLRAEGTATAPVVINGVSASDCSQPEINGENAVTALDARGGQINPYIEQEGIIKIFKSGAIPGHIKIQNLKLTGARRDTSFTAQDGTTKPYTHFSAAIYAVAVHDLTVENCEIVGNSQGVFTNSRYAGDYSSNIILRRNFVADNGYADISTSHNLYIQARRVLYEGNYIGQARGGSSLKDRSSGTVIRYNRVVASARALDLVESESMGTEVTGDPLYHYAWVYGNVIENNQDNVANGGPAATAVHWGFDNSPDKSRKGTLFFYNNTYMVNLTLYTPEGNLRYWDSNLFELGREGTTLAGTRVEAFSNVIWNKSTAGFNVLRVNGEVTFRGTNTLPPQWNKTRNGTPSGAVVNTAGSTVLLVADPKISLVNYVPLSGSPVLDKGTVAPSFTPAGATASNLLVTHQNAHYWGVRTRSTATPADLGARER